MTTKMKNKKRSFYEPVRRAYTDDGRLKHVHFTSRRDVRVRKTAAKRASVTQGALHACVFVFKKVYSVSQEKI